MVTGFLHWAYIGIINSTVLKYSFVYSCVIQFTNMITPESSVTQNFVDAMLSSVPTKIAGYLGVIYGIAIVVKKISEVWKFHQLDRYDVRNAKQLWEKGELENKRKRKDLGL